MTEQLYKEHEKRITPTVKAELWDSGEVETDTGTKAEEMGGGGGGGGKGKEIYLKYCICLHTGTSAFLISSGWVTEGVR